MSEMRMALDAWIAECNDPLDTPEDQLVRTRVYPPDGKQPTTATPMVKLDPVDHGKRRLTITCETEGASIGYRIQTQSTDKDRRPWNLYNGPVHVEATGGIEVVAHRIGFKPSPRVRF
jgi:hypothetical protein